MLEYAFRSKWDRPRNLHDDDYAAEVRVTVDREGRSRNVKWLEGSGNTRWDNSVRQAVSAVKKMDAASPTNFPPNVIIRFDVQPEAQPVLQ